MTSWTLTYKGGFNRPPTPQLVDLVYVTNLRARTTTTVTVKGPAFKTNVVSR